MRVVIVINHHGASESIAVLCSEVRVVPERSSVISRAKGVPEGVVRRNGTLTDALSAICPSGTFLEDTVPMLGSGIVI
jgi:hypothetical protein